MLNDKRKPNRNAEEQEHNPVSKLDGAKSADNQLKHLAERIQKNLEMLERLKNMH